MRTRCLILSLLLLTFIGSEASGAQAKIRYENGIKHIINSDAGASAKSKLASLKYEKEFSIDSESPELASLGLTDIRGFDIDSNGNVYILTTRGLDDFAHIFSSKGEFRASFGRRGQGPGELQSPMYLETSGSKITILDFGRNKLVTYQLNGSFSDESPIPPRSRRVTRLRNKNLLVLRGQPDQEKGETKFPVVLCDENFQDIKILNSGSPLPIFAQARSINALDLRIDYETWQVINDRIYVGEPQKGYDVRVYDLKGNLELIISKKYKPVSLSESYKADVKVAMEKNAREFASKLIFPSYFPAFQYYFLDDEGRMYVMTYDKATNGTSYFYDVFDANGMLIGKTQFDNVGLLPSSPMNLPVPLKIIAKGNKIYCLHEKDNGYKELVVYRWK